MTVRGLESEVPYSSVFNRFAVLGIMKQASSYNRSPLLTAFEQPV